MPPNFDRLRTALLLQGEPDRVPLFDGVAGAVQSAFLGRPVRSLADQIEFRHKAGYDYVGISCGLRTLFRSHRRRAAARYSVYTEESTERFWAEEGTGPITNLAELRAYPLPKAEDLDYTDFARVAALLPDGMRVVASHGFIFASAWSLLGQEKLYYSLYDDPDLVAKVFEIVGNIQLKVADIVTDFDQVGALWMGDDIAYNRGTLVAPRFLRQYVFPWYKRIGDLCRRKGIPFIYHSDGDLTQVMDDIVACGYNGLNPIDPQAMDIVAVKKKYGHLLCLIGNIDLVYTLTRGTPQEVKEEVKLRLKQLAPGGGYCLASANTITDFVPLANFNAMREAALEYGKYPISL